MVRYEISAASTKSRRNTLGHHSEGTGWSLLSGLVKWWPYMHHLILP